MSSQQSGMDAVAAFLASTQALSAGTGGLGHSSRGRPPARPRAPLHPPPTTSSQSAPASQQFSQSQVRSSAAPQPPHSNRKPLNQVALSSAAGGEAPRHPVASPHAPTPITRTTGFVAPNKPWWLGRFLKQVIKMSADGQGTREWKAHKRPHLLTISNVPADPRLDVSFEPEPGNARRKLQVGLNLSVPGDLMGRDPEVAIMLHAMPTYQRSAKFHLTGHGSLVGHNAERHMLLLPSPPETSKEEGEWWAFQFEKPQDYAHCISSLTALPGVTLKPMSADLNLDVPPPPSAPAPAPATPVSSKPPLHPPTAPPGAPTGAGAGKTVSGGRKRPSPTSVAALHAEERQEESGYSVGAGGLVLPDLRDPDTRAYTLSLMRCKHYVTWLEQFESWLCGKRPSMPEPPSPTAMQL